MVSEYNKNRYMYFWELQMLLERYDVSLIADTESDEPTIWIKGNDKNHINDEMRIIDKELLDEKLNDLDNK